MTSAHRTQTELERQFLLRHAAVRRGEMNERGAYGLIRDWILEIDGTAFMLHPIAQRWFCFDAIHQEWTDLGIGPGEAILVSVAGVAGAKRLPETPRASLDDRVRDLPSWFMRLTGDRLDGPHHVRTLKHEARGGRLLWSSSMTRWSQAEDLGLPTAAPPDHGTGTDSRYCTQCGKPWTPGDTFCTRCGARAR